MKLRTDFVLKIPQLLVFIKSFFIKIHISSLTETIIQFNADIATPMFGKCNITVRIDILRVVKSQFHHGSSSIMAVIMCFSRLLPIKAPFFVTCCMVRKEVCTFLSFFALFCFL